MALPLIPKKAKPERTGRKRRGKVTAKEAKLQAELDVLAKEIAAIRAERDLLPVGHPGRAAFKVPIQRVHSKMVYRKAQLRKLEAERLGKPVEVAAKPKAKPKPKPPAPKAKPATLWERTLAKLRDKHGGRRAHPRHGPAQVRHRHTEVRDLRQVQQAEPWDVPQRHGGRQDPQVHARL